MNPIERTEADDREEFEAEVVRRANDLFGPDTFSTFDEVFEAGLEFDRCSSCEESFEAGTVAEDRCPSCGEEDCMVSGLLVRADEKEKWVSWP